MAAMEPPTKLADWLACHNGEIIASYATGDADGGNGTGDIVGSLIGANNSNGATTIASYGFGSVMSEETLGVDRSPDANPSIHSPAVLTAAHQLDQDVWDFGDSRLYPALKWITNYDDENQTFTCNSAMLPAGQDCGAVIPGQHDSDNNNERDLVGAAPDATATFLIGVGN